MHSLAKFKITTGDFFPDAQKSEMKPANILNEFHNVIIAWKRVLDYMFLLSTYSRNVLKIV